MRRLLSFLALVAVLFTVSPAHALDLPDTPDGAVLPASHVDAPVCTLDQLAPAADTHVAPAPTDRVALERHDLAPATAEASIPWCPADREPSPPIATTWPSVRILSPQSVDRDLQRPPTVSTLASDRRPLAVARSHFRWHHRARLV